jgi:hypothetical protein
MLKVAPLPKTWLIHNIFYKEKLEGFDRFGNERFADPVEIQFVRYDEDISYSRDTTQNKVNFSGIIFVDAQNSVGYPEEFLQNSIIEFNGKDLHITKCIKCYHPMSNIVRHYELEVV